MSKATMVLNLNGTLWFDYFIYPDGALQVRLKPEAITAIKGSNVVRIFAPLRPNAANDFFKLALLAEAVDNHLPDGAEFECLLPYLPYARADRRFGDGDCFGLKMFADLVDTMGFTSVKALDTHSVVAQEMGIENISANDYILNNLHDFASGWKSQKVVALFPDLGAKERYTIPVVSEGNTSRLQIIHLFCSKSRDAATGKITRINVPPVSDFRDAPVLIIDDLCDGGATFIGIAQHLPPELNLGLSVTHGLWSKGFDELNKYFGRIYTTDSLPQLKAVDSKVVSITSAGKLMINPTSLREGK